MRARGTLAAAVVVLVAGAGWFLSKLRSPAPNTAAPLAEIVTTADPRENFLESDAAAVSEVHAPTTTREGAASTDSAETSTTMGTIVARVVLRGEGVAVPGGHLWLYDDEVRSVPIDRNGEARVEVVPGSVTVGVDLAPEMPYGVLLALPYDHETGDPAAEKEVEIAAGETKSVTLEVVRAGSIRGQVLRSNGDPVADFRFIYMPQTGETWGRYVPVVTDANGGFSIEGLAQNWYMLSPDPERGDAFAHHKTYVAFGKASTATIQLAATRSGTWRVEVVQEGTDEPYPFQVSLRIVRADGLADAAASRRPLLRRRLWTGQPPLEWPRPIHATRYRVTVDRFEDLVYKRQAVCRPWSRVVYVDVGPEPKDQVVRIEAPRTGEVAHVDLRLTHALQKESKLRASFVATDGSERHRQPIHFRGESDRRRVAIDVDLDLVDGCTLHIVESHGKENSTLAQVVLAPGTQEVILTPR